MNNGTELLTFDSGTMTVNGKRIRYGNRKIGITRHYAARNANVKIDKLVHIPFNSTLTADDKVTIGNTMYRIEQVQLSPESAPPCTVLTLRKFGVNNDVGNG